MVEEKLDKAIKLSGLSEEDQHDSARTSAFLHTCAQMMLKHEFKAQRKAMANWREDQPPR